MRKILSKIILVIAIILFIYVYNSCTDPISPLVKSEYPSLLVPIGRAKADSIQIAINTNGFFSYIDEYGLFSFSGTLSRGNSNITDKNIAVRLAKETVLKYSKYSNVSDTTQLEIDQSTHSSAPNFTDWVITFKNQKYKGIEVLGTRIIVIVKNQVSQICGHHFKEIALPASGIIPQVKLVDLLVGKKLETMCWTKIEVTLTPEMIINNKIAQNIIWHEVDKGIEFRVAWNVPISTSNNDIVSWIVIVDILSGEILSYNPTFIC